MRSTTVFVLCLALAGCGGSTPAPTDDTDVAGKDTVVGVCESWDQWTCVPGGSQGCYAECRPYYTLSCDNTNCFIQGRGTNGGRGCQITPSEQSCGFCESAVAQCL